MPHDKAALRRCAIYTRKSSEEGLEQDFNSLHAQREACESFIKSQQGEGWRLIKSAYDDGGLSGGTMERPALQRLLADIGQGLIDVVVVYKVDRLTRSLADFAKMVEVFDARGVSFVAVTQQFNTTTSMGRLTLNVLLSFAQFEREVTGERIRDKIAASKRKGIWMGGLVPLGYDVRERQVVVNQAEAETVRYIFRRYGELGCVRLLQEDLSRKGIVSKRRTSARGLQSGGRPFSRGALYELLSNPIYNGEIRHKELHHPGQHEALLDQELWERTQQQRRERTVRHKMRPTMVEASPLTGRLFDEHGEGLTPSHARKGERRYRYYVSRKLITGTADPAQRSWRLPAREIEASVAVAVHEMLDDESSILQTLQDRDSDSRVEVVLQAARTWSRRVQSQAESTKALATLVTRVDLQRHGMRISIKLPLPAPETPAGLPAEIMLTRFFPLQMKRRGVELRLVVENRHGSRP
jgi:site-specific DNA recombinase